MSLVPTAAWQDCWNQTGVQGDATCPRLREVSHCRNCPVYSNAASRLLGSEPPEDYLVEWSVRLAAPPPAPEAARTAVLMIFRLGAEWLALPAAVFQEVAEPRPAHSLPHRRGRVLRGVVNIRGELVVCVSLGGALGLEEAAPAPTRGVNGDGGNRPGPVYGRLVVVGTPGGRLAFAVSEVSGIEAFAPTQLRPVPETLALANARFTARVLSWRGHTVGCLDDGPLFASLNRSLG